MEMGILLPASYSEGYNLIGNGWLLVVSHKSVRECPSVCRSVGPSVMLLSAGRDEPANDLFRVYELVTW